MANSKWRDVANEMPKSGTFVLAAFVNAYGKARVVRAAWAARWTLPADDECGDDWAEYSEDRDEYFCPEGWYETNDHEDTHWQITDAVTHWMPLPEHPRKAVRDGE